MRNKANSRVFLFFFFSLYVLISFGENNLYAQEDSNNHMAEPVWQDEFEGTGEIDFTKWERQEYNRRNNNSGPDGWWSKEDSYLDGNGNLIIRVRKIEDKNGDGDSCDYSVGALRSKGRFQKRYGKFEIRCKLPTQPGWWVAFWMMQGNVSAVGNGGVDGTEVDIMEGFGWTNKINYAFHWDGYGDDHKSIGKQLYPSNIHEGFHTYALEWYPEMYIFYIDGEETWRSEGGGVCQYPGYIKVTGEISTEDWANNSYWANDPADAVYPDSFIVDYVRVYDVGDYQFPAAIKDISQNNPISLYPNPGSDRIWLSWDPAEFTGQPEVSIINTTGQVVRSFGPLENDSSLVVDDLVSGIYLVSVRHGGDVGYVRLVKE